MCTIATIYLSHSMSILYIFIFTDFIIIIFNEQHQMFKHAKNRKKKYKNYVILCVMRTSCVCNDTYLNTGIYITCTYMLVKYAYIHCFPSLSLQRFIC